MSSAKNRASRMGLRARMMLWTTAILAASLGAGFAWVHHGLRAVLEAKNDEFLEGKADELRSVARDVRAGGREALEAEVGREVEAYTSQGLVVVVHLPGAVEVAPPSAAARRLAERIARLDVGPTPRTVLLDDAGTRHRVVRNALELPGAPGCVIDLALSLSETDATLAQFDRRVAAGGLVFLALAIVGGLLLSRQALLPVARSIATARRLNPADLSARLPRTGSGDELDQLAATVNDLLDRLADYHAQITRFTADASHELRSPLAAVRAAVEVALQRPRENHEYREILGSLGEQCDRLTSLVNGLLLLARADAGELAIRREPVDLSTVVGEVAEMFQPLAEERGLRLAWDAPEGQVVSGDPSRLRQLTTNLVDNAIKFTESGGAVTIRVERHDGRVSLVVSDTGIGIARSRLPHVFERFYQADPARSSGGSGLGLSICRWIVEAHRGSIRAASEPGRGSAFTVELPATAAGLGGPAGATP